jgi:hypothetical protein
MEQSPIEIPHYEMLVDENHIYQHLNIVDKEHIVFNYNNLETFEDLQLYSTSLFNQSVLGVSKAYESPISVQYTNHFERELAIAAVKKGTTNIGLEEVKYTVSRLGYRLTNPLDTIKRGIGIFGCSITYGIGIPEDRLFINLLQKEVKQPIHNFGIPGGSVQKIAKSFVSLNNFYKLKKAIFLIPAMHRFEHMGEEVRNGKKLIFSESYIPSFNPINEARRDVYETVYANFQDLSFFDEFIKLITLIKHNAALNGTEVHFYTWDYKIQQLVEKFKIKDLTKLGLLRFPENEDKCQGREAFDFARDGMHPGYRSQQAMYELLLPAFGKKKIL